MARSDAHCQPKRFQGGRRESGRSASSGGNGQDRGGVRPSVPKSAPGVRKLTCEQKKPPAVEAREMDQWLRDRQGPEQNGVTEQSPLAVPVDPVKVARRARLRPIPMPKPKTPPAEPEQAVGQPTTRRRSKSTASRGGRCRRSRKKRW